MYGILAFGDSIVFGRGDNKDRGWVGRLRKYFEVKDYFNALYNLGVPGETSTDLLKRFDIEAKGRIRNKRSNDRYVIMIGIGNNDCVGIDRPDNHLIDPGRFRNNILKLINLSNSYTENVVFISFLPVDEDKTNPYEKTFLTNESIKRYNDIIKECCKEHDTLFIDIFDEWIRSDYKQLLGDGVHPNAQGYDKMYETIKDFLIKNNIIT